MKRRDFLLAGLAAGIATAAATTRKGWAVNWFGGKKEEKAGKDFPFSLSDEEWKKRLTPEQYRVLRQHGTERAFTSPLNDEHREGTFVCAGCDWPLFSGAHKFDSGTGWPSFWQPLSESAVGTSQDNTLFAARTEVHCANCGGHLGHVFEDGPKPTGLRYCMNGVAMKFRAKGS